MRIPPRAACFIFVLAALFLGACGEDSTGPPPPAPEPELIVYGRPSSCTTTGFQEEMDGTGIPYVFRNMDHPDHNFEFWQKVEAAPWYEGFGMLVWLPVVDVRGTVLMQPELDEVVDLWEQEDGVTAP